MNCTLSATLKALRHPIVVIGYGDQLHNDDAIGARVVDQVGAWRLPNVRSLKVEKLTPELAELLAEAEGVIFVDACWMHDCEDISVKPIDAFGSETPGSSIPACGHACDPRSLLALTQSVYGKHPQAWWVQVPATNFGVGDHLSATAETGINAALAEIDRLLRTYSQGDPVLQQ